MDAEIRSRLLDDVRALVAEPPVEPTDVSLFSSNTLFGEPGIYPDGPPMEPARGNPPDDAAAMVQIATAVGDRATAGSAIGRFERRTLEAAAPDPLVRAALALMVGTAAAPLLDAVDLGVEPIVVGPPASPGRVVGPGSDTDPARPAGAVVNERYGAEHPALLMPSVAHSLLWTGPGAGLGEEVVLHAVLAMLHAQSIARFPLVAHLGTELARRQNSLAITLLNSRRPGEHQVSLWAPDGPGTIPGGAPGMQTPDFAHVPFASGEDPQRSAPSALTQVLDGLVDQPLSPVERYDDDLVRRIRVGDDGRWLSIPERLRVAVALGLLPTTCVDDLAARVGATPADVVDELSLAPALAPWRR